MSLGLNKLKVKQGEFLSIETLFHSHNKPIYKCHFHINMLPVVYWIELTLLWLSTDICNRNRTWYSVNCLHIVRQLLTIFLARPYWDIIDGHSAWHAYIRWSQGFDDYSVNASRKIKEKTRPPCSTLRSRRDTHRLQNLFHRSNIYITKWLPPLAPFTNMD